jgi:hypothetical protein
MEGRMRHVGVVLLDLELHQGTESGKRVKRVEVEPLMLRMNALPRPTPAALANEFGPRGDGGEDLANPLGIDGQRDPFGPPPAQIRTSGITASGSCLRL